MSKGLHSFLRNYVPLKFAIGKRVCREATSDIKPDTPVSGTSPMSASSRRDDGAHHQE